MIGMNAIVSSLHANWANFFKCFFLCFSIFSLILLPQDLTAIESIDIEKINGSCIGHHPQVGVVGLIRSNDCARQ